MLIKLEVLEAIKSGEIDLQFRRWKRRSVKPGGTLKTRVGVLSIGEITPIEPQDVTDTDAKRAGFADVPDFLAWLDTMKPGTLDRIEVAYLGEDPRIALRNNADLSGDELTELAGKLDKTDQRRGEPDWSRHAMQLVKDNPGRLAEELAHEMGMEKKPFKIRIRALKALGLTESLEIGYRLSPRGERLHRFRMEKADDSS